MDGNRDSILESVKDKIGGAATDTYFEDQLIDHINMTFGILAQLGVGPKEGFKITGVTEVWSDFIGDNALLEMCRTYMYTKCRMVFDPPTTGAYAEAIKSYIDELEWRINVSVDSGGYDGWGYSEDTEEDDVLTVTFPEIDQILSS